MSRDILTFAVYMVHEMADAWNVAPSKAFAVLNESGCLQDYLVRHFDVLHTLGTQYLTQDINEYLAQRGYAFTQDAVDKLLVFEGSEEV